MQSRCIYIVFRANHTTEPVVGLLPQLPQARVTSRRARTEARVFRRTKQLRTSRVSVHEGTAATRAKTVS